jgi:RHS repeat-associated protein
MAMVDVPTGAFYFYLNDHLGNPQYVTNENAVVVWEARYLPFGQAIVNGHSTVENNFRFPGQYYDGETGLHYNYHRYYDPKTGRYMTADPIGLLGGINLYVYALNNPLRHTDSMGLDVVATCWYTSGGDIFGFGVLQCEVEETECIRKKREKTSFLGFFGGFTAGSPVGRIKFSLTFETLTDVRQITGTGSIATTSAALYLGASWGQVCLGQGCAYGWTPQEGVDLSADIFVGGGWIGDISEECCQN